MARGIQSSREPWQAVRPDLTTGVRVRILLDGPVKRVLTKVSPGGIFRSHCDSYGHLFHVLAGNGVAWVGNHVYPLFAGSLLQIDAGEVHGDTNAEEPELWLISLNLPAG